MPPNEDNSHYEKILATGEVKCIDDDIPFEIPKSWEWCRLGQILTVKGGKRIPVGCSFAPSATSHIYIRVTEMKNNTLIDKDLKYINEDVFEKIKNYTIGKDDLYLTIAGTIGSVGVVPEKFDGMNLTENAVKLTNLMTNKMFLLYVISSTLVQSQFIDKTKQVAQPKLAIERIQTTLIPFPPLDEQEKIVTKIEELLRIIEHYNLAQTQLNTLNSEINNLLKKSILQEAIQGKLVPQDSNDEPATVLLERIREEKKKLVASGKLKKKDLTDSTIFKGDDNKYYEKCGSAVTCIESELPFEIPDSWRWCKIGDIFRHNNGKQLNKGNNRGVLMDYITTSNLYWNGFVLDSLKQMPFEDTEVERCQAEKGDLLVCEGGDVGRSCIWMYDKPIMLQNHIHKLRAYIPICTKYFYYIFYLYNLMGIIGGKGIGIQGFSSKALHNTRVPLPPKEEQYRIVEKVEQALTSIMSR